MFSRLWSEMPRIRLRVWMFVFTVMVAINVPLWGRAGGGGGYHGSSGGHYSGGGFSGGGSHNSGSGGIDLLSGLYLVGIVIVIVIIFQRLGRRRQEREAATIVSRGLEIDRQALEAAKAELLRRDPGFDEERFRKRVQTAFLQVQDAWSAQDMTPVRQFVSDGIFERYSLQLEIMKASGITNRMDQLLICDTEIAAIASDPEFDAIDVYIRANAADWYVDVNGKTVYGDEISAAFAEYWTFIRRPGAQTLTGNGLTEHVCPNCGAPLAIVDRCECPVCKAVVNSGEYDWVLTEITQDCEWQNRPPRTISGYAAMSAEDPAFNLRHLEDRVSVMFSRWIAAQFFADPKYLRKLAADDFMTRQAGFFRPQTDGTHLFYADAAVGTVETAEVICAGDRNQVRVKVKWSGHRIKAAVPGLIVPDFDASHLFNQEFVLVRNAGVKSSDRNILASSHCPNCGAPETLSDSAYCEYCHAPLNDGSRDWVLADIRNFSGYAEAPDAAGDATGTAEAPDAAFSGIGFLDEKDGDSLIAAAAKLMLVDDEINPQEEKLLQRFAQQRKMSPQRLKSIIESVKSGDLEIVLPSQRAAALYFLRCLILLCLADGRIVPAERKLLCTLARQINIPFKEVELLIREEKQRLLAGK